MMKRIKFLIKRRSLSRSIRWLNWVRGEQGSFTLESSMVFPVILVMTLAMLLMSLYVYQKVVLYYIASAAAERAAFRWDNSHRSPVTGQAPDGVYDGLYWRVSEDDMLQSFLGLTGNSEQTTVNVPSGEASGGGGSLPALKLQAASAWIPSSYTGEISYERGVLLRTVSVKLRHAIELSPLEALIGRSEPKSHAQSAVVDPAEFIRSVELVRYYAGKFGGGSEGANARRKAATIVQRKKEGAVNETE